MGHGLDDVDVRLDRLLEHVGGVAGRAEAHALEVGPLLVHVALDLGQDVLGVLDGVALRQGVGLVEDVAGLVVDEDGLQPGRAAVEADDAADVLAYAANVAASKLDRELGLELMSCPRSGPEDHRRGRRVARTVRVDVVLQLVQALVAPDLGVAVCVHESEHHGTKRRVVFGILRWEDEPSIGTSLGYS